MADQQVGNIHGIAAVGNGNLDESSSKLAGTTSHGVNTVTVDNLEKIRVGMSIDIVTEADGTVVTSDRIVSSLTSAGVLTYDGADTTTDDADSVYPTGEYSSSSQTGFHDFDSLTIASLRRRLADIDSGLYTAAVLNGMTYNDMVYAVRVSDNAATVS